MSATIPEPFVPPRALLRHPDGTDWWAFDQVLAVETAHSLDAVLPAVKAAESAVADGLWAVGFCSYEAARAFDPALSNFAPGDLPLAGFALCEPPTRVADEFLGLARGTPTEAAIVDLRPALEPQEHATGVQRVKRWIAQGDTYQVNYTYPLRGTLVGDAWDLFRSLYRGQGSPYAAWLDLESHFVCSASPELFFSLDGERLATRPMKGTMPRGRTTGEDSERAAALAASAKNRAENVMIVDMIRNDLARVARPGSVRTTSLLDIERYPTVFQMTSTVEARTECTVQQILAALFPCASITGAPKVRTTELIRRLEAGPRGLYTGAIGWLAPGRRAQFSVAIRTAVVAKRDRLLTYGTGGGIVWDSDPGVEYAETIDKARILTAPRPPFDLLETLAWRPEAGYDLLVRHLDRLADSAAYFDYPVNRDAVEKRLEQAAGDWDRPRRVRLTVAANGAVAITSADLAPVSSPLRVVLGTSLVDSRDPFLFHKTTHRSVYERARRNHPEVDDVLLVNERGELTESTVANLVLDIDGELWTPPISSGLLAGTQRAALLADGTLAERVLTPSDLGATRAIYVVNSVRGWMKASLLDPKPKATAGRSAA